MITDRPGPWHDVDWFHGRLSRDQTFRLLVETGTRHDGLFLVRESSNFPGSFVLSLWNDNQDFHYQIRHHGHARFSIDEGPVFPGLDTLVNYYREQAGGLTTKLTRHCVGRPPPPSICQTPSISVELGRSLYRACETGDENEVHNILLDPNVNLETMNDDGVTALHIACQRGSTGIVWLLIKHNGNVNSRDKEGRTPLMYACRGGNVNICEILLQCRGLALQDRSYVDGYVALHIAAMCGYRDCVELLLKSGAPIHPRARDGDTPKDLAKERGHYELEKYLENVVVPAPKTKPKHWLHENVDREAAVALLYKWQLTDGLFLVRTSTKMWGVHVLTMAVGGTAYHFQIKGMGDRWFYIDDGPLFATLPHLVEYYGALADGLPHQLTRAIQPNGNPPIPLPFHTIPSQVMNAKSNPQSTGSRYADDFPPKPKPALDRMNSCESCVKDDGNDQNDNQLDGPSRPPRAERRHPPPPPNDSPSKFNRPPPPLPTEVIEPEPKPQTIIGRSELEQGAELGQGEFGSVLRGIWKNPGGKSMDVALKTLHPDKVTQGEQEFLREARVMSGLNHICIVKLLGVCLGPPLILVQELVSMGALLDFLINYMQEITLGDFKLWAAQIAWGMNYLEEKRFVHRDLATRNILLQSRDQIKISDFGLSRAIGSDSNYYVASKGGRWPVKWYAPESINYGRFSHESDVWSYGVTLWEMFSFGQLPYGEMTGAEVMEMVENDGKRLSRPDKCPEHTYQLMLRCWDLQSDKRPTFAQLHAIFKTNPLYSDVQLNG